MPKLYEALAEAFLAEGIDMQFVVLGTGNMRSFTAFAKLSGVHNVPRMMDYVREVFHIPKYERRPAVLGIPHDLQRVEYTANAPYETSAMYQPKVGRMHPDPEIVAEAVRAAGRGNAAYRPRWPRRVVVRRTGCGDQTRRSLRRLALQHAASPLRKRWQVDPCAEAQTFNQSLDPLFTGNSLDTPFPLKEMGPLRLSEPTSQAVTSTSSPI